MTRHPHLLRFFLSDGIVFVSDSPTDDLSYGDGLKRLEKQESWNQPSNPLQERKKKSSKGDCKQQ